MTTRRSFLRSAVTAGTGAALLGGMPGLVGRASAAGTLPDSFASRMPAYLQPGVPRGLNLSFASDDLSQRAITWLTSDIDTASYVQYGAVGATATAAEVTVEDLDRVDRGSSVRAPFGDGDDSTYLSSKRENGPDVHDGEREVFVHRATMAGLEPGQRVAYRVGDGTTWSPIHIARGGAVPGAGFRFTHFGDHGTGRGAVRGSRAVLDLDPDWHLIAGDISYADGDQRKWDLWSELYQPTGSHIPMMASPGNHEAKDFMGEAYRRRFTFPNHGASFFSWTYDNVFMVSTPAGAFFGDEQGAMENIRYELIWLEHTLAYAAALRAVGDIDFIVVTQHFPSYTDHRTRGPISADRVVVAEQILQRYQIDLLLVGHDHMYQRSHPMAYGQATTVGAYRNVLTPFTGEERTHQERYSNATGYIEVIAGSGGKSLYEFTEVDTFDAAVDEENPFQRTMPWLAASAREQCIVDYDVRGPEMHVTGMIFDDGNDAGVGDGIVGNAPGEPGDLDAAGNRRPIRFDPDARPQAFDRFVLERKAYAEEVPTVPRSNGEILAGLPEARGSLRYDLSEDCTLHDH